jgi:hypothetical protein
MNKTITTKEEVQKLILYKLESTETSLSVFAKELGVSRQSVNQWLKTDSVTFDKLFDLLHALGADWEISVRIWTRPI